MKEKELRENAICGMCGDKVLSAGLPMFWRVTVERFGIDLNAVQRQQGLTMMMGGNAGIAAAMGLDEEMAKHIIDPIALTICEPCCTKNICVAGLAELEEK